jgi:predicted xylose isomerase-like sugar epimerase
MQHAAQQDADRAAIRAALARPEVREVAEKAGLDIDRANAVVNTLDGAGLDRAASVARQVNEQLSGGSSTIVISPTTIIIVLLLVLLIVIAVK